MSSVFFISSKSNLKGYLKANVPNLYQIMRDEIIYPIFRQQVLWSSQDKDITLIKLVLSRRDVAHFTELYRRYEAEGGQSYYNQNNQWRIS